MGASELNAGGGHPGGVEILLVASCYRNRDKLRPDGPLGSNADFTFTFITNLAAVLLGFGINMLTDDLCGLASCIVTFAKWIAFVTKSCP